MKNKKKVLFIAAGLLLVGGAFKAFKNVQKTYKEKRGNTSLGDIEKYPPNGM